ncbi:MAG: DEAD/DEAH box helicase [Salibacteraceae bacterium]
MGFKKFNLNASLQEGIDAMQYTSPTPVQEQALPIILKNEDLMGFAQTGTGKTAAFLIPILQKLDGNTKPGIKCLILVPTRELAQQIEVNLTGLGYFTSVSSQAVYGGNQGDLFSEQKNSITSGVDIIIATPGRFLQHLNLGYVKLDQVEMLVLDEADRMLDMGFVGDILKISELLPKSRQTLLFSATMDGKIKQLASKLLKHPNEINLAIAKPAAGINQMAFMVYDEFKIPLLEHYLKNQEVKNMIVFASRKTQVDQITRKLDRMGFSVVAMHSDKTQDERNEAMRLFKAGKYTILVATDIVSRGIDIDELSHVINFDVPNDAADYVHRIGRTARAGKNGAGISFISPDDQIKWTYIEKLIEREVDKFLTPEEIGKSPEYNPSAQKTYGGNKNRKFKKKNNNYRGKKGNHKGGHRHKKGNSTPQNKKPE